MVTINCAIENIIRIKLHNCYLASTCYIINCSFSSGYIICKILHNIFTLLILVYKINFRKNCLQVSHISLEEARRLNIVVVKNIRKQISKIKLATYIFSQFSYRDHQLIPDSVKNKIKLPIIVIQKHKTN